MLPLLVLPLLQGPLFEEDPSALSGVTTTCGGRAKDYIVEVNGGGLVLADFDGDGDCDLAIVDGSTLERVRAGEPGFPPRLFLNDGSGRFAPAPKAWAMEGGRWGMGGAAGDVDGDGDLDLVVTQWGPLRLFLNEGGEGFREVTDGAGFSGAGWGASAAFLDYEKDGVLDLAVARYLAFDPERVPPPGGACSWKGHPVMCGPEGLAPEPDQLYRGKGDGTFEDATRAAGMVPEAAGFGLGLMTLDYDLDGDTDLYVANDSTPNFLWENRGDGTFEEVAFRRGASHDASGREQAGMGIACGDLDGDGRAELFVTNFSGESNALYLSRGDRGFRERSAPAGLAGPSVRALGWGTALEDFDLDGDLDLFVANGHVYPQADLPGTDTSYAQADVLFRNEGPGRFRAEPASAGPERVSRACAAADLDGDGDLDLVVIELDGAVRVLRNRAIGPARAGGAGGEPGEPAGEGAEPGQGPHWLRVALRARGSNRFALGARLVARWEGGSASREIKTAGGFHASVPPEAHFGLGPAPRLERLEIRWPSGRLQVLEGVAADRVLVVEEPEE